jgi:hypothetical protein
LKYNEDNATGDAGEYLFAYTVSNVLGWPCRLLDIDIGIDAQIEILDDDRNSMGQFIAVQVKSTRDKEKFCTTVEEKHIKYWSELEVPVLIVFVNLSKKKVYARPFDDFNGSQTLHFSKEHIFNLKNMKERLRLLAYSKVTNIVWGEINDINENIIELVDNFTDEKVTEIAEPDYFIGLMHAFKQIELDLHKVKITLTPIHKIVSDLGYKIALSNYMEARRKYTIFLHQHDFHIYNHDDVTRFKNEYVEQNSYLKL